MKPGLREQHIAPSDLCKKQQVPPLRYAPVGMTLSVWGPTSLSEKELSSRPERSVVEGPAVSPPQNSAILEHAASASRTGGHERCSSGTRPILASSVSLAPP